MDETSGDKNAPAAGGGRARLLLTAIALLALVMLGAVLYLQYAEYKYYQEPPSVWPGAAGAAAVPAPAPASASLALPPPATSALPVLEPVAPAPEAAAAAPAAPDAEPAAVPESAPADEP